MTSQAGPIQIDATALLTAADALRDLPDLAADIVADAQVDGATALQRTVRKAASRHRATGKMIGHVTFRVKGTGWQRRVVFYAGGVLAHLSIFGTRPHRIPGAGNVHHAVPVTGSAGTVVGYHGTVTHPGTHPDPWFARGTRAGMPAVQDIADEAARTIASRLANQMEG